MHNDDTDMLPADGGDMPTAAMQGPEPLAHRSEEDGEALASAASVNARALDNVSPAVEVTAEIASAETMPIAVEPPGPPPRPEDYVITSPYSFIGPDPVLNAKLYAAGFTQAQAQLVYDLAGEHLVPMIQEIVAEVEARRHQERLEQRFGGPDAWRQMAGQLKSWGTAHLAPDVLNALSGSYDGVIAIYQMMQASEPALLDADTAPADELDEAALTEMMRDPRYWQQRDPEFVARVTAGFRKLYGD